MVTGVDEQFGRILEALREAGLDKNTIVIFTSDHGDCLGKHGQISKSNPYEESMHVPFIIRWPGKIRPGKDDLLLSVPDIYPTLMGLLGLDNEVPPGTEGTGYAALLTGKGSCPRPSSQFYFMTGEDLYPSQPEQKEPNLAYGERGVRTVRYTLSIRHSAGSPPDTLLFDRVADPMEMVNLATSHPEIVGELVKDELIHWLQRTGDPWK
jgi:arylsulfatase A-like enzyme